ncbi:MAG: outer membrane protein assembly factor BamD [Pyrinomonadaceae bacterium MAG19_C2-C3]|nr:outer membrane protein assembly factor BamD [Pyrinomonadaceae bacterium MAG19_C2-C3]
MQNLFHKTAFAFTFLLAAIAFTSTAHAQGVGRTNDISIVRDPELEAKSLVDLRAARFYFKERKAYFGALDRCEAVLAENPMFSQLDEVLYIAGSSSLRLSRSQGRQAAKLPPEKLREQGRTYLTQLVKEYPASDFKERAETELREIEGEVKATIKKP